MTRTGTATRNMAITTALVSTATLASLGCSNYVDDDVEKETQAGKPGYVEGPGVDAPMESRWPFAVPEDGASYGEWWELGRDEQGREEWCTQRCTNHWHRDCTWNVVNGVLVRDESSCTPWRVVGTSCDAWVCPPGTTPPPRGGGTGGGRSTPPPGMGIPPMSPQAMCAACDREHMMGLNNAQVQKEACDRGAEREASRRCKKMGIDTSDCRYLVKNGGPFGIEIDVPKTGVALTDLLPGGTPLAQICKDNFDKATIAVQQGLETCRVAAGCLTVPTP
jgi:hypothetical protein